MCEDTGIECANSGVVFRNMANQTLNVTWYDKVKVADLSQTCLKFKDPEKGGKLEDEDCAKDKHAGCYSYCRA